MEIYNKVDCTLEHIHNCNNTIGQYKRQKENNLYK